MLVWSVHTSGLQGLSKALADLTSHGRVSKELCYILAPLHSHDASTRSNLRETLIVYVEEGGNLAATADRLFLHRNSVFYRLQRIEDISGINVRDRRTRRLLMIALALDGQFKETFGGAE